MTEASTSTAARAAPTPASFNDYNTALQTAALKATKHAAQLPADIPFHRSVDRAFAKDIDTASARVLALANRLLALAATTDSSAAAKRKGKARLESEEDVVDNFHAVVVDSMDQLLERADIRLDEFLGRSKPPAIAVNPAQPTAQKAKKTNALPGRLDPALQHASTLTKPQLSFKRRPDNNNMSIWHPTLKHKYNAQVPLGYNLRDDDTEENLSGQSASLHPYRYEIRHTPYPAHMFASTAPVPPRSFDATPFTWVSDSAAFDAMLEKLRGAREIAIDLEHHSYRTFAGFVCLMQISTREEDWVVDTLALRDELEALNEVFTDPRIVKVLHGAESDIVWLQQDFNLYIVNLFDTYHASKVLDFPRHGLATLLEMYCDFTADKKYQLADWRIRPLPEEMLAYARSDTHFLLYIYDNLRNALLDRGQSQSRAGTPPSSQTPHESQSQTPAAHALVREVLARSEETALRVYEKELYDYAEGGGPGGWDTLAKKWNKGALTAGAETQAGTGSVYAVQRAVYRCVHAWRDRVAREEDESTRYVLPNHYLFVLADKPPADMAALLSAFHPVPPVIRRRSKELLDAIRQAVKEAQGATKTAPADARANASVARAAAAATDAPDGDIEMSAAGEVALDPTSAGPASSTDLWAHGALTDAVNVRGLIASRAPKASAAAGSALLDNPVVARVEVKGTASFAAAGSALFGDASKMAARPSGAPVSTVRFREVVARIHGTLVIAPSVPRAPAVKSSGSPGPDVSMDGGNAADSGPALEGAVEIPFVPAAQRGRPEAVEDDSIVVVGQRRAKKRKRVPKSSKDGDEAEAVEAFDYGAVSNILDEEPEPEPEDGGAKRRKKKQGAFAGYQYGNFPAPPPARAQPQSGNQTRTFR
ncbi:uncharacterized protein C8Q71DRAFT_717962 [Rhodofomes roseus]|uniref:HRDC domain-containing protein n=1 Tax=Rhodofomes roseus TaxID=34475 RepID=A0ABQ8K0L7_9APHY|nr:uncharacterized protein C8Q71DRAFT_717962 [Rhodofomes roseus]KAH9829634.1 hypothetical protein C8Q71DRAFT_717962 [Rhodofomes roseus]